MSVLWLVGWWVGLIISKKGQGSYISNAPIRALISDLQVDFLGMQKISLAYYRVLPDVQD